MIKEFDEFPIFYFSNHNSIHGPNENIICMPSHFNKLDYELEIAILIGQEGSNILAKDADRYIAGYMILNDFSARDIQMQEMKLNLGPAKGKDFASVLGPYLVTPDEISKNLIKDNNNQGNRYNLKMSCLLNGELVSEGNTKDMHWTFEQIIERASYGVTLYPGDIIGSGTVGTGCLLELNGTHKLKNPNFKERWLKEGDVIEMKVDGLGEISNKIIANNSNYSII
jgi:fumarylacetoacetate (FAA) hydrolase